MIDKEIVERAKEAEKREGFGELVHSTISKGVNSAFGIGFIEGMVEYRNSLQEEPVSEEQVTESAKIQHIKEMCKENDDSLTQESVSEDLEQAIDTYLATYFGGEKEKQDWPFLKKMAIHFAEWQKQKDSIPVSEELEEVCEQLTENARKHKAETSSPFFSPTDYKQGVMDGANWQKEQIVKRLCNLANIERMAEKFEDKYKPKKVLDTEYYKRGIFDTIKAIKED